MFSGRTWTQLREMCTEIWWGNISKSNHLEDWNRDWSIILKCILRKLVLVMFYFSSITYIVVHMFLVSICLPSSLKLINSLYLWCWNQTLLVRNISVLSLRVATLTLAFCYQHSWIGHCGEPHDPGITAFAFVQTTASIPHQQTKQ